MNFWLWFTHRLLKSTRYIPIYIVKSTDWFKKGVLQETNGLNIGCKFTPSLVYLQDGGWNFEPDIFTLLKFEHPQVTFWYILKVMPKIHKAIIIITS